MTAPIRETIARAILYDLDEHAAAYVGFDSDKMDETRVDGDCNFLSAADAVLRALDEAGCVVVRKDEFFASRGREPCAMELEWARQQAQDLDLP